MSAVARRDAGSERAEVAGVPRRRRRRLVRLGRRDGAAARPDPFGPAGALTTPTRTGLAAELIAAVAQLRCDVAEQDATDAALQATLEAAVARDVAEVASAEAELATCPAPDPAAPMRRAGETARTDDLVAARRRREHEAATAHMRTRREAAAARVVAAQARLAELQAQREARQAVADRQVHLLVAVFEQKRAIYDAALVRRHPRRDEIDGALDATVPPLPGRTGE